MNGNYGENTRDHASRMREFVEWFHSQGDITNKVKIDTLEGLRGIYTTDDVEEDEVVILLPFDLLFCKDRLGLSRIRDILAKLGVDDYWEQLIIMTFFESKNENSFWRLWWGE